ncbi:MAG: GPW/gp25 family protein [Pirellulales bacterium]
MLYIDFPYTIDQLGQTAKTSRENHRRDMLVQFLLTIQGERVNRPDFGTPLFRMCFEGNTPEIAEVIQFIAKAGLQRWLGQTIEIVALTVEPDESILKVDLKYRIYGEEEIRTFDRSIPMGGRVMQ